MEEKIDNGFVPGQEIPPYSAGVVTSLEDLEQIQHDAYYSAELNAEDTMNKFDETMEEYAVMGNSSLLALTQQQIAQEEDESIKQTITALIDDDEISAEDKKGLLTAYTYGYNPPMSIRDKYVETISAEEAATSTDDEIENLYMSMDKQKLVEESLKVGHSLRKNMMYFSENNPGVNVDISQASKLLKAMADLSPGYTKFFEMSDEELEENDGFFYGVGVNATQLFNAFIAELPMYIGILGSTPIARLEGANPDSKALDAFGNLFLTDNEKIRAIKNMTEMRRYVEKLYAQEPEKVLGFLNDYQGVGIVGDIALNWRDFWHTVMRVGGLVATKEEFDNYITQDSITMSTFETIDEGFLWVAKKINPTNPEAAKVPLEIASFFVLAGAKKGASITRTAKRRYDLDKAGYDKTVSRFLEALDAAEPGKPKGNVISPLNVINEANNIKLDSPYQNIRIANSEKGNKLTVDIIRDFSGKVANSVDVKRTSIIGLAFAPIVGGILNKGRHLDMHEWSLQETLYRTMQQSYFTNEGHLFPEKRKAWIRDTDNVLDDISAGVDIYQRNSDSIFYDTGTGLDTSIVFSKNDRTNYKSVAEASDATTVILEKIKESGKSDFQLVIEHVDGNGAVRKTFDSIEALQQSPLFRKAIDSVANLEANKANLLAESASARKIILNKERVKAEAELQGVTPKKWLRVAKVRAGLREVEIRNLEKEIQVAKELEGKVTQEPNLRIRINRKAEYYDSARQITDGFNNPPKRSNLFTQTLFGSTWLWKGLAQFGAINAKFESKMQMAGLRSEAWFKDTLTNLQKDINRLDQSGRNDMALLYKKSLDHRDYLTVNDITTMLGRPDLPLETAYLYQNIITKTRGLNRFRFQAENLFELDRLVKLGYKESFVVVQRDSQGKPMMGDNGKPITQRVVAKDDFEFPQIKDEAGNLNQVHPKEVWDFENGRPVESPTSQANFVLENKKTLHNEKGNTNIVIYRLAKNYTDAQGRVFEYGIFRNQEAQALPQQVLRSRTGHMPSIMKGTNFVRMYPKEVTINGISRTFEKHVKEGGTRESWILEMQNGGYARAIAVAPTEIGAQRWLRNNLDAWAKESNINTDGQFFEIRIADELRSGDRLEANTIREESMASSKQRTDLPVAKAAYEDTFASFVMATESNGSRAYMAPLLNEYKQLWIDTYKDKVVGGLTEFPKARNELGRMEADVQWKDTLDPKESRAIIANANKELQQIMILDQGHVPNWIGRSLQKVAGRLAEYGETKAKTLENSMPVISKAIEKALPGAYAISKRPSLAHNFLMRTTSTLKIQWQIPWWHWAIQTANSWGHLAVGGYAGFNKQTLNNYIKTASQSAYIVHMITRNNINSKKYAKELGAGYDWLLENDASILGRTDNILDLSKKDLALIIANGKNSGFFHIADHTFAKNFFSQGPKKLQSRRDTRVFGKMNEKVGQVGFEQGELMGRINTWMAARLDWAQKNPGKDWRGAKALEEINTGARKLAGSMDKYGEMGIQRVPILATFAQFSSFIFKSSEGLWNTSATPFNAKQMAALTGWNTMTYGVRGGVWYGMGGLLLELFSQAFGEEKGQEIVNDLDDLSLLNIVINGMADAAFPTYDEEGNLLRSDLEFNLRFSPMGADMPFGGYGAIYRYIMNDGEGGNVSFGPSGQLLKDIFGKDGVTDMFSAIWSPAISDVVQTEEQVLGSYKALAKLTGLTSGLARAVTTALIGDKRSKLGQLSGQNYTKAEQYLFGWSSVQSKAERLIFENFANAKDTKEADEKLAEQYYKAMVLSLGETPTTDQISEVVRGLKATLTGSDFLSEERAFNILNLMTQYQRRGSGTLIDNVYTRAVEKATNTQRVSPEKIKEFENLQEIFKNNGNQTQKEGVDHILMIMKQTNASNKENDVLEYRKERLKNKEYF